MRVGARVIGAVLAASSLASSGCGRTLHSPGDISASTVTVTAAQRQLAPDGSVPFVDEVATDQDFSISAAPAPEIGTSRPCRADQVRAGLDSWARQGEGDNEGGRRPPPGLYGYVHFTAVDPNVRCTLQGEPGTQLFIDQQLVPLRSGDVITAASKHVVTIVSGDTSADLRVDWSPPYCGAAGTQQLEFALPHDGGQVTAEILRPRTPACTSSTTDTGTHLQSFLLPSAFTQHQRPIAFDSPLAGLRASVIGAPTTAAVGQLVHFRVRLTNVTASAILFDPCPGFILERFILGTQNRTGFNTSQLYRLNCRPVGGIPADGSLEFQMQAPVPSAPPGNAMSITWRLLARNLSIGTSCHLDVALSG